MNVHSIYLFIDEVRRQTNGNQVQNSYQAEQQIQQSDTLHFIIAKDVERTAD